LSTSLRVLIANLSEDTSRRLILDLAQGGFIPSYIRVDDPESLVSRLTAYEWDLVLAGDHPPGLDPAEAVRLVRQARRSVPMVTVRENSSPDPALEDPLVIEVAADAGEGAALAAVRRVLDRKGVKVPGAAVDNGVLLHRAYFEQLFENSPQAIAILNHALEVVEVNRGFETLFGYTPDEVKGRYLPSLVVPPQLEEEAEDMRRVAAEVGIIQRETVRIRKDGTEASVLVVGCPINAGGVAVGMFWIYTDITARRKAEDALRLAERQYRGVVQNAVMGIFQATLDLNLTMVNPALAEILGCSSTDELLARPELCELFLNDPEKGVELWSRLGDSGEVSGFEVLTKRLDGSHIWLALSARLVQGAHAGQRFLEGTVENVTGRKLAEERLKLAEEKYRTIFEHAQEGIYQTSLDGKVISANPALARILGCKTPQELIERVGDVENRFYVTPGRREEFKQAMLRDGSVSAFESQAYRTDGRVMWISEHARLVKGEDGDPLYFEGTMIDITKRKIAEENLRWAEAKYRSIFEHSPDGIYQVTPRGEYISANHSLAAIFGYPSPEHLKVGLSSGDEIHLDLVRREEFKKLLSENGQVKDFESEVRRRDGKVVWISETAWEVRDEDGALQHYEGLIQDVSARKSAEQQLRHQAFHDALTGLPNRMLFMDRLEWALSRSKRKHGYRFAVFFLDLDRFKIINDSLGHLAGDKLLVEVAQRLKRALRPMDTVARFGGDEFAVLVDDISGTLDATHILSRLHEELAHPFDVQGRHVFTSASVGVVLKTWTYERAEHLVRDADIAMYRAKALGKDRYEIFDPSLHQAATSLLQLETDLRLAVEREELRLHYQPIVSIDTGEVQGFEALARWQHPTRGLIAPTDFIPVAEETGLIMSIGNWVLENACRQLARWQKLRPQGEPLTMSVNISAKQFMNLDLVAEIRRVLEDTGIPPETLKLEITETKVMENAEFASRMLTHLKELGVKISIDDFGTGYSSLAYLHRFPLDTLKIDRSFVGKMGEGQENSDIVGAIVGLAHSLGLEVVAEGVEQHDQLSELKGLSCQLGQGYLFSRPVPTEEAERLLTADFRHP